MILGRSKSFSKIDLQQAFLHLELDEEEILTVNTDKGLFWFNRLAFGVHSCNPAEVHGYDIARIPKTQCMLDDIIIAEEDEKEHSRLLEQVVQ